jgi:hypothetical protein
MPGGGHLSGGQGGELGYPAGLGPCPGLTAGLGPVRGPESDQQDQRDRR